MLDQLRQHLAVYLGTPLAAMLAQAVDGMHLIRQHKEDR